jgi:hypothetical protein
VFPSYLFRLFSDTFRAEQEGLNTEAFLHLHQRGREDELLKTVVVTGDCGGRAPERVLLRRVYFQTVNTVNMSLW